MIRRIRVDRMRIETTRFGSLELSEAVFIQFPWGIPGFENLKRYVLLEHGKGPFQWLQAVDEPAVAFVVCAPETLGFKYKIPREKGRTIHLDDWDDLLVLIMVSFDRTNSAIRPHQCGPLLFNTASKIGCQWTIDVKDLPRYVGKANREPLPSSSSPE